MQLIVLGTHRSGTSAVAKLLNMMGAYFAPEELAMGAQPDNPKGFWERWDVVNLDDEILAATNGSWDAVSPINLHSISHSKKESCSKKIKDIVQSLDGHQPWMVKDPRMCLTFPLWREHLKTPIIIYVYRNPIQIAQSLKSRNNFPIHFGLALWEFYTVSALNGASGLPHILINYRDVMSDPVSVVSDLHKKLGQLGAKNLKIPQKKEILSFIDQSLFHEKGGDDLFPEYLTFNQSNLVSLFDKGKLPKQQKTLKVSAGALELLAQYGEFENSIAKLNNEFADFKEETSKTISALHQEVGESAKQNKNLQDSLDTEKSKNESLQSSLDTANAKSESLQSYLDTANSKNESLQSSLDTANSKNESLQSSLDTANAESKSLQNTLNAIKEEQLCLTAERDSLLDDRKTKQDQIDFLNSCLKELNNDINATFSSLRWKVGNGIFRIIDTILMRLNKPIAKDHIEEILGQYQTWKIKQEAPAQYSTDTNGLTQKQDGKWASFYQLFAAIIKHPVKTLKFLSLERIKNLYITYTRQPDNVRDDIVDYYLKLYGEGIAKPETITPVKHQSLSPKEIIEFPKIKNPVVSIIVPVFNQFETTFSCLQTIAAHTTDISYEVILADDCSTDKTTEIDKHVKNLIVAKTQGNLGFLRNCNNAAKSAKGQYLYFLNNDTNVTAEWLSTLVRVMENDKKAGIVGSKFIYPDGKLQEAGGIIWNDASGWNYGRLDDPSKPEYNYLKEVDYISGAGFLIRKNLWDSIGGFDELFVPAYYEDTDLAFETRKRGYKVIYQPKSVVVHFEGVSHGTDESQGIKRYQLENRNKFLNKWQTILKAQHLPNAEKVFLARDRSKNKKTILVIDHYVPHYDKDAGSKSTFQYLKWFVESGLNVKFIGDNFYQHEPYTTALQQLGIEVLYGPWYAENWGKWLQENEEFIDYVYLHRPHISIKYIDAVKKLTKAKVIYFGHDLHYLRTQRQYEVEKDKKLLQEAEAWKKKEFDLFRKCDVVYYPSDVEVEEIKKHFPDLCVRAIPLYILDKIEPIEPRFKERHDLFFVGGFRHTPNVDGVLWFVKEVFPLVLEQLPDIRFVVAGAKMPDSIKNLASDNIIIKGEISENELAECYYNCRVVVVPLRYGAGIKGKVLEALKYQVPVVTTDIGAEGLPVPKDYLLIANEKEEFANKIIEIYSSKKQWNNLVMRGREALNQNFSGGSVSEVLGKDIIF